MKEMSKEQTAVKWLEEQLLLRMNGTPIVDKDLFDEAKEMEICQIVEAFDDGVDECYLEVDQLGTRMVTPDHRGGLYYYQKTFKNEGDE
jgi:hypothetical protein